MEPVFIQLAVILFMAFIFSFVAKTLKQPVIIGYIIAGVIISPFFLKFGATSEVIEIFSRLGIAFLLFIVGLHLNPKVVREIGLPSLVTGLGQMILTFGAGFLASWKILNFSILASVYVGIAVAFSSTIIIMKLLSDKQNLDSLYGKISIGILIIQDLVAIGVLLFISSLSQGGSWHTNALNTLVSGTVLILVLFIIGYFILPKFMKNIAESSELLFLFSICWCFLVAALFSYFGLSIEIGALVAGVVLSISPYSTEISSKIRPLRDFFLVIFFIIIGFNIKLSEISSIILGAMILSFVVLILKPVFTMLFLRAFRYTKRTNFLVGTGLAQISEFSLIILVLGISLGHINEKVLHTTILTMVLTIILSTYLIIHSEKIYSFISKYLSVFERKKLKEKASANKNYDYILFGENRIGFSLMKSFINMKKDFLVVDFNPSRVRELCSKGVSCVYGDVSNIEFLEEIKVSNAKLIVSTVPEKEINMNLLNLVRGKNKNGIIIVTARQISDALDLYKSGADYVILPHFLGGEYTSKIIESAKENKNIYKKEREKQIKDLKERLSEGQEHPVVEK